MVGETIRLAEYAAGLRYEDLPTEVIAAAKDAIIDTIAACICGSALPWSRIIIDYAERTGPGGASRILGRGTAVQAPAAALANGALAHAFELDSLTRPGAGAHPGATVLPPALAIAQERGADGRALIAAFVAGNEVMIRIGRATAHTNEARGFHAPGTTGPFGAAVACAHLLGLDAAKMTNAIGIAGSLAGGLLEFAKGDGGMVKRLHLGRASEAGVLAASLAASGFTGPRTVLEGQFGFLRVFCTEFEVAELTKGLGRDFVTTSTVLKRYPVHATAHAAVRAVRDLQTEHGFTGGDVEAITVTGNQRMVERHAIAGVKLSYFGTADPAYYAIPGDLLPSHMLPPPRVTTREVKPGDLLHADANGVTTIPLEIAPELPAAAAEFVAAESILLDYLKSGAPTVAAFADARRAMMDTLEALSRRLRKPA